LIPSLGFLCAGVVPDSIMLDLGEALRLHLGLNPTDLQGDSGAHVGLDANGPQRRF
jgi:hypothetical protein